MYVAELLNGNQQAFEKTIAAAGYAKQLGKLHGGDAESCTCFEAEQDRFGYEVHK